jgi:hypothetical protein
MTGSLFSEGKTFCLAGSEAALTKNSERFSLLTLSVFYNQLVNSVIKRAVILNMSYLLRTTNIL